MRRAFLILTLAGSAALAAAPALAQLPEGSTDRGRALAQIWCSGCHLIDGSATTAGDVVPSFAAIAAMKSTTVLSLQVFLQTPHGKMPDWRLTRQQIDDVVTYIMSLRHTSS
jgi:mono/diheme cytochrome c family protein